MRSELGRAVRKHFGERLQEALPHFETIKGEKQIPAGSQLYRWHLAPNLDFYLLLQAHHTEDWFTLELAWTRNGRWPAFAILPGTPDAEPKNGDLRFRLGQLWAGPHEDVWWQLAPRPVAGADFDAYTKRIPASEALARVEPLVEDAVERLVRYGMPYLAKVSAAHGYSLEGTPRGR